MFSERKGLVDVFRRKVPKSSYFPEVKDQLTYFVGKSKTRVKQEPMILRHDGVTVRGAGHEGTNCVTLLGTVPSGYLHIDGLDARAHSRTINPFSFRHPAYFEDYQSCDGTQFLLYIESSRWTGVSVQGLEEMVDQCFFRLHCLHCAHPFENKRRRLQRKGEKEREEYEGQDDPIKEKCIYQRVNAAARQKQWLTNKFNSLIKTFYYGEYFPISKHSKHSKHSSKQRCHPHGGIWRSDPKQHEAPNH